MANVRTAGNSFSAIDEATTTHAAVSVGTSSTSIAVANADRIALYLQNDHATQVVYLSLGGTAEANKGIRLNAAGGGVVIDNYMGAVAGIATGATTPVLVAEL